MFRTYCSDLQASDSGACSYIFKNEHRAAEGSSLGAREGAAGAQLVALAHAQLVPLSLNSCNLPLLPWGSGTQHHRVKVAWAESRGVPRKLAVQDWKYEKAVRIYRHVCSSERIKGLFRVMTARRLPLHELPCAILCIGRSRTKAMQVTTLFGIINMIFKEHLKRNFEGKKDNFNQKVPFVVYFSSI